MSLYREWFFGLESTTHQLYPSVALVEDTLLLKPVFMFEQIHLQKGNILGGGKLNYILY